MARHFETIHRLIAAWKRHDLEAVLDWLTEDVDDDLDGEGRHLRTPYMGAFEFRDGRIHRWRDSLDAQLIAHAQAGEPMPEWLEELVG